jgi:hypothetical protein
MDTYVRTPDLIPPDFGERAGILGALALAREAVSAPR